MWQIWKECFSRHRIAVMLSIVFGVIMVLPMVTFPIRFGVDQGILPQIVDDQLYYMARVQDVMDGHPTLSNAYVLEHKGGLPQQTFLAEDFLGGTFLLLHLDVAQGVELTTVVCSMLAFLLTYAILELLTRRRGVALGVTSVLLFGIFPTMFMRFVSPQVNFLFWLSLCYLFLRLVREPVRRRDVALASINFGLLFYLYPYYWTYYVVWIFLLIAAFAWKQRVIARRFFVVGCGAFILALPYFFLSWKMSHLPVYAETLTRLGLVRSHLPTGIPTAMMCAGVVVIVGLFVYRRETEANRAMALWCLTSVMAALIAGNQQLITGQNLEFSSHYYQQSVFMCVFALTFVLVECSSWFRARRWSLRALLLVCALVILLGLHAWAITLLTIAPEDRNAQRYALVFSWLHENAQKDEVVYADEQLSEYIPVYTSANVLFARNANLFILSDQETIDRWIVNNYFSDINDTFLFATMRSFFGVRYIDQVGQAKQWNPVLRRLGLSEEPTQYLPTTETRALVTRASELQSLPFSDNLKRYRVDYIVQDRRLDPGWDVRRTAGVSWVEDEGDFSFYRVNH